MLYKYFFIEGVPYGNPSFFFVFLTESSKSPASNVKIIKWWWDLLVSGGVSSSCRFATRSKSFA